MGLLTRGNILFQNLYTIFAVLTFPSLNDYVYFCAPSGTIWRWLCRVYAVLYLRNNLLSIFITQTFPLCLSQFLPISHYFLSSLFHPYPLHLFFLLLFVSSFLSPSLHIKTCSLNITYSFAITENVKICNQTLHRDKGKRHLTDNDSTQDNVLFMHKQT